MLTVFLVVSLGVGTQRARVGILDTFMQTRVMVSEKPSQAWSISYPERSNSDSQIVPVNCLVTVGFLGNASLDPPETL